MHKIKTKTMKRIFNIISRAIDEFGLTIDMDDTLQEIFDKAYNAIWEKTEYDYVSECERGSHYDFISWEDGHGYTHNASGEFISSDDKKNAYFRKNDKGEFNKIEWFDHTDDDYILMDYEIDTNGRKVALVCK